MLFKRPDTDMKFPGSEAKNPARLLPFPNSRADPLGDLSVGEVHKGRINFAPPHSRVHRAGVSPRDTLQKNSALPLVTQQRESDFRLPIGSANLIQLPLPLLLDASPTQHHRTFHALNVRLINISNNAMKRRCLKYTL